MMIGENAIKEMQKALQVKEHRDVLPSCRHHLTKTQHILSSFTCKIYDIFRSMVSLSFMAH